MRLWGPRRRWPTPPLACRPIVPDTSLIGRHRNAFLSCPRSSFALAGYQLLLELVDEALWVWLGSPLESPPGFGQLKGSLCSSSEAWSLGRTQTSRWLEDRP